MVDIDNKVFDQPEPLLFQGASGTKLGIAPQIARFSLAIDKKDLSKAADAFGAPISEKIGTMVQTGQSSALCLGPEEWQLMLPLALANPLTKNFNHLQATTSHSLVDLSHSMIGIEISGPLTSKIIGAGCPLDLFVIPVGHCARTLLDKVQVVILKTGEQKYLLEVTRSYAPFASKLLENAAIQYEAEYSLNSDTE